MHNYIVILLGLWVVPIQNLHAQSILKAFTARQIAQNAVYLEWTTKAGNTCADLGIERSFENGIFEEVYQYNGICGESDKDQDYSHTDSIMQGGRYGYRINENNGDYSDTIFVQAFTDGEVAVVYPNPAIDNIYLRIANANQTIVAFTLCGLDGKCKENRLQDAGEEAIQIHDLTPGVYQLIALTSDGKTIALRFVRRAQ
jgi:hypothetical protein